jgi:hypothetical protein
LTLNSALSVRIFEEILSIRPNDANESTFRTNYQPQQSVLNPHSGQRQTACIRYISALPQRSQIMESLAGAHFCRPSGVG